jgi:hypothetical protein
VDQVLQQNDLEHAIEEENLSNKHHICEKVRFETFNFHHLNASIEVLDSVNIEVCYHLMATT